MKWLNSILLSIADAIAKATKPPTCSACGRELGSNPDHCEPCFDAAYYDRAAP